MYVYTNVHVVGVNVTEDARDFQVSVMKYVTTELGLLNSYDTWHGKYRYMTTSRCYVSCFLWLNLCTRNQKCSKSCEKGWSGKGEG